MADSSDKLESIKLVGLPEIAQKSPPGQNVWLTRDSGVYYFLRLNLQSLAVIEATFFGVGLLAVAAMIVGVIWS